MRSASTLGIDAKKDSNSVGVAFSRRRYLRQDDGLLFFDGYYQIEYNAFG